MELKSKILQIRLSENELKAIKTKAKTYGTSVSQLLRTFINSL